MIPIAGGFTAAQVYRLQLAGGRSAVAKVAPWSPEREPVLAGLATEALILGSASTPFMPRLIAADPGVGALVIEDLGPRGWLPHGSDDTWPVPPLQAAEAVWRTVQGIRALPIPPGLPPGFTGLSTIWDRVVGLDVSPVGIPEQWWTAMLPQLVAAAREHTFTLSVVVHGDFKGANLCLRGGYAVAVDWSGAHVGDPGTDVLEAAIWLRMAGVRLAPPSDHLVPLLAVYGGLLVREFLTLEWGIDPVGQRARELKRRTAIEALRGFAELVDVPIPRSPAS